MPANVIVDGKQYDLLNLERQDYKELDKTLGHLKEDELSRVVNTAPSHNALLDIFKSLATVCCETNFELFNSQKKDSFLAFMIRLHIEKQDGQRLRQYYAEHDVTELSHFKFSVSSIDVFALLKNHAIERDTIKGNTRCSESLPGNLLYYILEPLIAQKQADLRKQVPTPWSKNPELLDEFLENNSDVEHYHQTTPYLAAIHLLHTEIEVGRKKGRLHKDVIDHAHTVINTVKALRKENKMDVRILTEALSDTTALLLNTMSVKDYKEHAQKLSGARTPWMRVLGAVLMVLAAVATAAAVVMVATGVGIGAGIGCAAGSAFLLATGYAFFARGRAEGLPSKLDRLAKYTEKYPPLVNNMSSNQRYEEARSSDPASPSVSV